MLFYLCSLSRACLSHQHKRLVPHQDLSEALSVLPHGKLQPLVEDLIVAWRVGQVSEGVDLLLYTGLLKEAGDACSWVRRHPGRLHISVLVTVSIAVPRPLVTVSVAPVRARCMSLRFREALPHEPTDFFATQQHIIKQRYAHN